jgi:hypothetical protein
MHDLVDGDVTLVTKDDGVGLGGVSVKAHLAHCVIGTLVKRLSVSSHLPPSRGNGPRRRELRHTTWSTQNRSIMQNRVAGRGPPDVETHHQSTQGWRQGMVPTSVCLCLLKSGAWSLMPRCKATFTDRTTSMRRTSSSRACSHCRYRGLGGARAAARALSRTLKFSSKVSSNASCAQKEHGRGDHTARNEKRPR